MAGKKTDGMIASVHSRQDGECDSGLLLSPRFCECRVVLGLQPCHRLLGCGLVEKPTLDVVAVASIRFDGITSDRQSRRSRNQRDPPAKRKGAVFTIATGGQRTRRSRTASDPRFQSSNDIALRSMTPQTFWFDKTGLLRLGGDSAVGDASSSNSVNLRDMVTRPDAFSVARRNSAGKLSAEPRMHP